MRKYIVVAYDITDDGRRNRVADILSMYGQRVNKSVFECFLKERDITKLKTSIERQIRKNEDIILYYYLCKDCVGRIERIGTVPQEQRGIKLI